MYFMRMGIFPACMSVHHMHARSLQRSEEGIESPGTRVIVSCHVGAGKKTQCCKLRSHLSSPLSLLFKKYCLIFRRGEGLPVGLGMVAHA